jgi:spore maturation protein CgeB
MKFEQRSETSPMLRSGPGVQVNYAAIRVLVIGSHAYPDSFEWHLVESLRHLGCGGVELFHNRRSVDGVLGTAEKAYLKAAEILVREPERRVEEPLLRKIAEFDPVVILVVLGNQLSPKTMALIRKRSKARIVCWCQDQMTTLGRQFLLASGYDAVFVKDRYMHELFSAMIRSTRFYYLPEACNPRMHRPMAISETDRETFGCDLMIAGTLYYYRQEILLQVAKEIEGIHLRIWGSKPQWLLDRLPGRYMGRQVHGDDKVRAALSAKICLNTLHYGEVNGLNCRAFELAGCGGFQLLTRVPVLSEHFVPEVEVATFGSVDELIEKCTHYLRYPAEAAKIAERGRQRAHRDHTYEHRLAELMQIALQ